MKIKLFQLQKNKRFNYTPRYYEGKEQGNAFEMGSRIRRDRETVTNHFTEEWRVIRNESRNKKNAGVNKTFWIILAILILITLYFLDFDLSIFKRN
ncbi:hypothetical protein [Capnocytophaga sputigena]|jgi:hypothetical protein|uniref:hypothetical protein n=1 Tax=Capnocytophaga sputigena TaxID=1019 RepID=UPI0028D466AA|nr:hypothetical protein [Capnocytophaga sputigena]